MGHTDDDFFGNVDDVFVSNCFNYSVYDDDFNAFDLSNENCTDYLGDYFDDDYYSDYWNSFNYDDFEFIYREDDYSDDYSDDIDKTLPKVTMGDTTTYYYYTPYSYSPNDNDCVIFSNRDSNFFGGGTHLCYPKLNTNTSRSEVSDQELYFDRCYNRSHYNYSSRDYEYDDDYIIDWCDDYLKEMFKGNCTRTGTEERWLCFEDSRRGEIQTEKTVTYGLFAVQGVAIAISAVVVVGLLIPLLKQLKNGTFYQTTRSQRSAREPPYSTYNLYLAYSALVDLIFVATQMALFSGDLNYAPITAVVANLWINAFIVYEVLALLRASKSARRITQPSLTKVNLQAGVILTGMILFTVFEIQFKRTIGIWTTWYCLYFIPILYVIGVTIFVKCKAYLPPSNGTSPRDKAIRSLALFFFRVIIIVMVIWIPVPVLVLMNTFFSIERPEFTVAEFNWAINFLFALQPILNFCLILTKPDVKKYILEYVTLKAVAYDPMSHANANQGQNATQVQVRREHTTTILGYTFSDVDDDNGSASGSDSDAEEVDGENDPAIEDASDGKKQDEEVGIQQ